MPDKLVNKARIRLIMVINCLWLIDAKQSGWWKVRKMRAKFVDISHTVKARYSIKLTQWINGRL